MDNNQFKQLLDVLKDISSKLSILIAFEKSSAKPQKIGGEEGIILKLCNGKNSIDNMIESTGKKRNNIEVVLTHLRKKGMIRSTRYLDKTVYVKI